MPPSSAAIIALSPPTLPGGTVGVAFDETIAGSGGASPYSFGVTSGTLPAGLTLTAAGVLAGTPTTAGSSTFTVRATDAAACFGAVSYSVVIAAAPVPPPACGTITLSPATLPGGRVGIAFNETIAGSGGASPYSFGVTSGTLPAGLTLTAAGVLAGTPTTAASSTFTVRATDAAACFGAVSYSVVIAAAPVPPAACATITLSPPALPGGTVGVAFNETIAGSGGASPYSFGVTSGTLPAGLTLTAAGVLAGRPTTAGSSTFTVRATDADGCGSGRSYTVGIPVPADVPALSVLATILLACLLVLASVVSMRRQASLAKSRNR